MEDSNYTIGLLIASCLVLLAGVVLSVVEISEYGAAKAQATVGQAVPEAAAEAVETPEEEAVTPAETPPEEAAPAEEGAEGEAEGAAP